MEGFQGTDVQDVSQLWLVDLRACIDTNTAKPTDHRPPPQYRRMALSLYACWEFHDSDYEAVFNFVALIYFETDPKSPGRKSRKSPRRKRGAAKSPSPKAHTEANSKQVRSIMDYITDDGPQEKSSDNKAAKPNQSAAECDEDDDIQVLDRRSIKQNSARATVAANAKLRVDAKPRSRGVRSGVLSTN